MYKGLLKFLSAASVMVVSGCATYGTWQPTIDPYGSPNAHRIQQDLVECRHLALQASGGTTRETVTGGLVGGAIGAATGAAIGAATGHPGGGAALGAAAGGMGGGTYKGLSAEEQYKDSYIRCMRGRGHRVVN